MSALAYDSNVVYDTSSYTYDGLFLTALGLGFEVLLWERPIRHLSDPIWPQDEDPRGSMTKNRPFHSDLV